MLCSKNEREKLNIGLNWKFTKRNQEVRHCCLIVLSRCVMSLCHHHTHCYCGWSCMCIFSAWSYQNQPTNLFDSSHLSNFEPCLIQILGYARKVDNNWSFSPAAVSILEEFQSQFPGLLEYICANPGEDKYYEEDLFPDAEGWVLAILLACVWLSFLEPWSV